VFQLGGASLSGADLSDTFLIGADFFDANLSDATFPMLFFPQLILAVPSFRWLSKVALLSFIDGTSDEKNNIRTGQSIKQPFKRITKYMPDGKPIINKRIINRFELIFVNKLEN
jgi:hypothetical protein